MLQGVLYRTVPDTLDQYFDTTYFFLIVNSFINIQLDPHFA